MKQTLQHKLFRMFILVTIGVILLQLILFALFETIEHFTGAEYNKVEQLIEGKENLEAYKRWDLAHEFEELGILACIGLVTFSILAIFLWNITIRLTTPLRTIATTAQAISEGNLDERIHYDNEDEIGAIISTLNRAFDRCQSLLEQQRRFSGDASHQLRTPLTALQNTAEVLLSRERDASAYRQGTEEMLELVQELARTVEHLLLLSRMDHETLQKSFESIQIKSLLGECINHSQKEAARRNIELKDLELKQDATIKGTPSLLKSLFNNLIENAIRATPENGLVAVRCEPTPMGLIVHIEDNGPGIPLEQRERIFERFQRAPGTSYDGCGLGLSLAAEVAHLHQATIEVGESTLGGARFSIRFETPLSPENYFQV